MRKIHFSLATLDGIPTIFVIVDVVAAYVPTLLVLYVLNDYALITDTATNKLFKRDVVEEKAGKSMKLTVGGCCFLVLMGTFTQICVYCSDRLHQVATLKTTPSFLSSRCKLQQTHSTCRNLVVRRTSIRALSKHCMKYPRPLTHGNGSWIA